MATGALKGEVAKLNSVLEALQALVSGREVPRGDLEELRMAVDSIRRSVWDLLTAENSAGEYDVVIARSRARQAAQLCHQVSLDINAGYIEPDSEELGRLNTALKDTLDSIDRCMRGAV